jgi:hypothetical protein
MCVVAWTPFRLKAGAASHHEIDREHFPGQAAPARRDPALDPVRLAAQRLDHRGQLLRRGRHDR